jgi:hypothetical protein
VVFDKPARPNVLPTEDSGPTVWLDGEELSGGHDPSSMQDASPSADEDNNSSHTFQDESSGRDSTPPDGRSEWLQTFARKLDRQGSRDLNAEWKAVDMLIEYMSQGQSGHGGGNAVQRTNC